VKRREDGVVQMFALHDARAEAFALPIWRGGHFQLDHDAVISNHVRFGQRISAVHNALDVNGSSLPHTFQAHP